MHPGREDVIGIPDPGDLLAFQRPSVFLEGLDIGHHLTGVAAPGQPVDDGDRRSAGQIEQVVVAENADHDGIDIAAHDTRRILDGLLAGQLHFLTGQHKGLPAELAHADVEGHPRAGRLALENHGQNFVLEQAGAFAGLEAPFQLMGEIENGTQLLEGKILEVEKMSRGHNQLS